MPHLPTRDKGRAKETHSMENGTIQLDRDRNGELKGGGKSSQTESKEEDMSFRLAEIEEVSGKPYEGALRDLGTSPVNMQKTSSSPLPVPTSSPPTISAPWNPHGVLNTASDDLGNDPPGQEEHFSHPECLTSSPASNAENGALPGKCQTPGKAASVHTDNAAMLEESLRHVLSDPITGDFLDDAMVARCGHSFGSTSLNVVCETGKCILCGASVPPDSLVPNFALRAAVQAFKREDHIWQCSSMTAGKRRREQSEQPEESEGKRQARELLLAGEQTSPIDISRPRGVQFPFAVSDRVLIKGNKRTPERFVGREAIITSQCLNGWYLVRTLDSGESVRLQYRSLQKLGEIDQHLESGSSPDATENVKNTASGSEQKVQPALSVTDGVTGGGKSDVRTGVTAYPTFPVKGMRTESHKKLRKGDLTRSAALAATSSTAGASSSSSLDMQSDAKMISPSKVAEETKVVDHMEEDDPYDMKQPLPHPIVLENAEVLIRKGELGSGGDHLVERPRVWEASSKARDLNKAMLMESNNSHNILEVEKLTEVVPTMESGDSFTVRSKRSALTNRGPAANAGPESDPYRKVYASRSNRRGGSGEGIQLESSVVAEGDCNLADHIKEGGGTEPECNLSDQPSREKSMQDAIQMPNMKEILSIMRKDILNLESQIPGNCLKKSWKIHRTNWRKGVKEGTTVEDLGAKVKVFRSSLLLTMAGGMTDGEWDKRLDIAKKANDVEMLVSLWGRLYEDVNKWLHSKPKRVQGGLTERALVDTFAELRKKFPQVQVDGLSPVEITTATMLAAADAVVERHLDADELLAVPTKLLQQHSRTDLRAIRESLEREKRHIVAKLGQLEAKEIGKKKEDLFPGFLAGTPIDPPFSMITIPSATVSSLHMDGAGQKPQQGDEADAVEDDGVIDKQVADGEATDMSDSD